MRVLTTPYARRAMDPETLAYIEQERPGRDGTILSLSHSGGGWVARLYDPELGDFHVRAHSLRAAVLGVIAEVSAA
jgi:hypothetical protein